MPPATQTTNADPDFAFTSNLSQVFVTQPVTRTVVELTGWTD